MPDIVQNVVVDFQVDYSQLITAQEQLAKGGKIDPSQFQTLSKAIESTATDTKGLIADFKKVASTAVIMGKSVEDAFASGVQDALDEAGVSVDEFAAALSKANKPAKTLKQELRELKEAIAQAKANGKDFGTEFDKLTKRAGVLQDAMADANQEIKNAGSDTRNLDNVVGSISALAGGFAAAQGAAALFGDENEDVQKALLKVNAAMALASGVQQFYNATLKEGALTKLADSIATGTQSAAITLYTFVMGAATTATKVFRAALIATGIGALVVLVVSLVQAMQDYSNETKTAADEQARLAEETDRLNQALSEQVNFMNDVAALNVLRAKAAGKTEAEITAIERKAITDRIKLRQQEINQRIAAGLAIAEVTKAQSEDITALQKFDLEATIAANKAKEDAAKKQKELNDKAAKEARERRLAALNDTLAFLERDLLAAEKGSAVELDIKKKIVRAKRDIELQGEKLTKNQVLLIKAQALVEQQELQKAFNAKATEDQLKAQIDRNNAELAGIKIGSEERLRLTIETIEATSQLEINAANGNAAKILAIEADKQAKIRAVKNAAIDQQLQDELRSVEFVNNIARTGLQRQAADRKQSAGSRIAALRAIESIEIGAIDKAIEANEKKIQSDEDYQRKNKELQNQKLAVTADTAQKIKDVEEQADKDREDRIKNIAAISIAVASQVADFYSSLAALATEQDRQRIEQQKSQLQALIDAGAITAKQAKQRAQEIEIAEKKARQAAAVREKQAAVFKAVLAIPTAFLQGLSQGGIYLAAIYAALAAAQAAVVIAKPVPKFFRGKKDNYEGPGIVGDMGAELVERNGRMYVYAKPTETYLGVKDKVYTAAETRQILHNTNINTVAPAAKQREFDYERLAKAIPRDSFSINIDKDGFTENISNKLITKMRFDQRYKYRL